MCELNIASVHRLGHRPIVISLLLHPLSCRWQANSAIGLGTGCILQPMTSLQPEGLVPSLPYCRLNLTLFLQRDCSIRPAFSSLRLVSTLASYSDGPRFEPRCGRRYPDTISYVCSVIQARTGLVLSSRPRPLHWTLSDMFLCLIKHHAIKTLWL
jgi:hypothetical protein